MSEQENPDFSFLNEQKNTTDSAILEKQNLNSRNKSETDSTENTVSTSDASWMNNPQSSDEKQDSGTRFASVLSSGTTETDQSCDISGEQKIHENYVEVVEQSMGVDSSSDAGNMKPRELNGDVVSKKTFVLTLSYASAVTVVCALLVMQSFNAKPHELESLPDLKPPMKDEQIAYRLVPESAGLPRGHSLKIGQSRRFGNLLVTPTKVVYEPIRFVHYSKNPAITRPASKPVMKLWLNFKNVSKDQKFSPLDRQLMLTRIVDSNQGMFLRSNQFLCPAYKKGDLDQTSLLYDLEMLGNWNFAGIEDNPMLSPGQSIEIYLPSDETSYDRMEGKIVWRVQFRKGYHPVSRRGVTTLIEVVFKKNEVVASS